MDRNHIPIDVANLVARIDANLFITLGTELLRYDELCASNPDPPEDINAQDWDEQFRWGASATVFGSPRVLEKIWAFIRYNQFWQNCVCNPPPPPAGLMCPWSNVNFSLPVGGRSTIAVFDVPQSIYDTWPVTGTPPNQDWKSPYQLSYSLHSPATTQRFIEWSSDQVVWHPFIEIPNTSNASRLCSPQSVFVAPPRIPPNGWVSIHNNSNVTLTLNGFSMCFCGEAPRPPDPPIQPPLPSIPTKPTVTCGTTELCAMVEELTKRIGTLALQISDIQAVVQGHDVLDVISSQEITGEGEATLALGTRAVSLELTALSDNAFTSALGRPRGLMRVGSVRWGDGVGYSAREFIDGDRFDRNRPAGALSLSWQLLPPATAVLKFLR